MRRTCLLITTITYLTGAVFTQSNQAQAPNHKTQEQRVVNRQIADLPLADFEQYRHAFEHHASDIPVEGCSMNRKLQVFVSSTYQDMETERQAAVEAILTHHHIPAGMELFAAGNKAQLEVIYKWIDESDVFVLLLGGRYGTLEPESKLSYTELEYDYAERQGKFFFALVQDQHALDRKIKRLGGKAIERASPDKYEAFREKVMKKQCRYFSDARDINIEIGKSLKDAEAANPHSGWVRANGVREMLEPKPGDPPNAFHLQHVSLAIRDLDRSVVFYGDVLGLRRIDRPPLPFGIDGAWFECPTTKQQLHLVVDPKGTFRSKPLETLSQRALNKLYDTAHNACHFAMRVYDVGEVERLLLPLVKRFHKHPYINPLRYPHFYVLDPDGHVVEINGVVESGPQQENLHRP